MQIEKFETIIKKGNNRGAGFISIPKELRNNFKIDSQIKLAVNRDINIYAKIRFYGTLGFYIPYEIMMEEDLIDKIVTIEIEKVNGFYTSIGEDGRIYIPQKIAKEQNLKQNDIVEIEGFVNGVKEIKYLIINFRARKNTTEYMCYFDYEKSNNNGLFRIVRKLPINAPFFAEAPNKYFYGKIDDEKFILYNGKFYPIIVNSVVKLSEIALYLGCYFADGTKKGFNWAICASTFEQANYYYKMHKHLIFSENLVPYISFTDTNNSDKNKISFFLNSIWKQNVKWLTNDITVRIINSDYKPSLKINKFGTLVIRESRQLTQIYYNRLLQLFFTEIKDKNSKDLALDFICGVLEGDGSVSTHLGHLVIATNNKELEELKQVLNVAGFKYNIRVEGVNKSMVHIGLLEIIRNISKLKDKIFIYYPKRRKLLKERLLNTASVRFLLGKTTKTSNWLIGQFNEMGILDGRGNLTEFGIKIREDLKKFLSE